MEEVRPTYVPAEASGKPKEAKEEKPEIQAVEEKQAQDVKVSAAPTKGAKSAAKKASAK
ncbi:hypothetical protein TELCIR_16704 [Teladorsagia circumcincta]|uniref:Uncharacterized protein n=1 Tax=Teladorsagia circumcincta TaxID=45464 RepID=A0A2G9TUW1_TELCI|nr:hypothetical protein TELCIR_16704 [Teladorsagia circumcincta]